MWTLGGKIVAFSGFLGLGETAAITLVGGFPDELAALFLLPSQLKGELPSLF